MHSIDGGGKARETVKKQESIETTVIFQTGDRFNITYFTDVKF